MRGLTVYRILTLVATIGGSVAIAGPAVAQSRWSPGIGLSANTALGRQDRSWGPGVTGSLLRRSGRFAYGIEGGYLGFGTEVTRIDDFNNQPGYVYREEFRRSMLRIAAVARFDAGSGGVRPYLIGGAGAYDGRFKDHIEVTDPNGVPVPFYDFDWSGSDVKPAVTAGLGLVLTRPGRRLGVEIEGRWHGILDVTEDGFGTANFISLGLGVRW